MIIYLSLISFFEKKELVDLFGASLMVLMRKDMSLTRRFYSWILLTDPQTEQESLPESSFEILVEATRVSDTWKDFLIILRRILFRLMMVLLNHWFYPSNYWYLFWINRS